MNFDWSLFKFTERDCYLLAKVVKRLLVNSLQNNNPWSGGFKISGTAGNGIL